MSDFTKSSRPIHPKTARAVLLGASLSTLAVAGATSVAKAETAAEEACAFAMLLRSVSTVERVLEEYPGDACVPLMLSALSPDLLAKIDPALVDALPPSQRRLIPKAILEQIGADAELGSDRAVAPRQTRNDYNQYE